MKFSDALVNMIGDFANLNRSPDFRTKSDENAQKETDSRSVAANSRALRRHSLNLSIGVSDELPVFSNVRHVPRRQSLACTSSEGLKSTLSWKDSRTRRRSEPIILQYGKFHRKLARLKDKLALGSYKVPEDENESSEKSSKNSQSKEDEEYVADTVLCSIPDRRVSNDSAPPKAIKESRGSIVFIDDDYKSASYRQPQQNEPLHHKQL